ncbi:ferredoxin [Mycobacterium sp. Y57]|uniref:ferredoxin n=1 Tax=Mycolicibacterium xanthum TaxID=2796469 RepID=UPI001C85A707|nr:ferredoxin [Mycolicibacterium xanthum]MBX7435435.1 ferredoxin [Mycolicibacterium xanthum]
MTVRVDPRLCEGHGICAELAPDIFDLGDDDVVTIATERPGPEREAAVRAAAAACPRQAITVMG